MLTIDVWNVAVDAPADYKLTHHDGRYFVQREGAMDSVVIEQLQHTLDPSRDFKADVLRIFGEIVGPVREDAYETIISDDHSACSV
jgi:hypothetical protein